MEGNHLWLSQTFLMGTLFNDFKDVQINLYNLTENTASSKLIDRSSSGKKVNSKVCISEVDDTVSSLRNSTPLFVRSSLFFSLRKNKYCITF